VNVLRSRRRTSLIVLGGVYQDSTMSTTGPQTRVAIGKLQIGTLFLSATSFSAGGVYCATPFDAETKQALIEVSRRVVLIADSSKASGVAPAFVCPLESVDVLITDLGLADPPAGLPIVRVPE
jgi:DeoR family fructose operon transcriptional repressor